MDGDAHDLRALAEDLGDGALDSAVGMLLSAIDWVGDRLDTLEEMAAAATPRDTAPVKGEDARGDL